MFKSILHSKSEIVYNTEMPDFFEDTNINQVIDAIVASKEEYNLKPFFYTSLTDKEEIIYRQEIMKDIENLQLLKYLKSFAENMQLIRNSLTQIERLDYDKHKARLFLDVVKIYCETLQSFSNNLAMIKFQSKGFVSFFNFLLDYIKTDYFLMLETEIRKISSELDSVKYCLLIQDLQVTVRNYKQEPDLTKEIETIFDRFKQKDVSDYRIDVAYPDYMNHVEAKILEFVAQLNPEPFTHLLAFYSENKNFRDETIIRFDREVQFYISFLEYIEKFENKDLKFCYPQMNNTSKEVYSYDFFDLALAEKLLHRENKVITNDFYLTGTERILIVSGPNQSGKTTFARTFAQIHYFASIGCKVPGNKSQLFIFDKILVHFESEENIKNLSGKLQNDLQRIYEILQEATPNSILILNEIFTSTTLQDAIFLSKKIMQKISELDLLCVWVSFIDELSEYNEKTVSMMGEVVKENPDLRTFKIVRKPADSLAFAISIAEKYKVTYNYLKDRIKL